MLDALEQSGQLGNTLIIFLSDHGEHLGDRLCFGKRSMHDSAARLPLLVRWPDRFGAGQTCDAPTSHVDIAPTILGAAGTELGTHSADGVDLAELAAGAVEREMVFSQHCRGHNATYMAVSQRWKYVYSAGDDREFLFDRVEDPDETRSRAGLGFRRGDRDAMKSALIAHLRAEGETEGLEGDDWKRFPGLKMPGDPDAGLLIQDHRWADTSIPGYTD
jgi:arylsulfatase A-like enzyme